MSSSLDQRIAVLRAKRRAFIEKARGLTAEIKRVTENEAVKRRRRLPEDVVRRRVLNRVDRGTEMSVIAKRWGVSVAQIKYWVRRDKANQAARSKRWRRRWQIEEENRRAREDAERQAFEAECAAKSKAQVEAWPVDRLSSSCGVCTRLLSQEPHPTTICTSCRKELEDAQNKRDEALSLPGCWHTAACCDKEDEAAAAGRKPAYWPCRCKDCISLTDDSKRSISRRLGKTVSELFGEEWAHLDNMVPEEVQG